MDKQRVPQDKICSVFGHRDVEVTKELYMATTDAIERALDFGCRVFYFGGYGDFDELCYQIVSDIQTKRPALHIQRVYCVPQEKYLYKKVRYFNKEDYDEVIFLPPAYSGWYKSIYYRNCAMIDESDCVIFYCQNRENSGAHKAYDYAKKKKGKQICNLFEKE